jgi:hypothetical protein
MMHFLEDLFDEIINMGMASLSVSSSPVFSSRLADFQDFDPEVTGMVVDCGLTMDFTEEVEDVGSNDNGRE